MKRLDGRKNDQLRPITITKNYIKNVPGSVLIEIGKTRVICVATIEENVPKWLKDKKQGWITSEYSMLPYASNDRKPRESTTGKVGGRTQEIQRLVGRSLRGIVDLKALGERTIWIDCDVIEADGGTRTASITGGFIALMLALKKLREARKIASIPVHESIAAVSAGLFNGIPMIDLCYEEDSKADVDMNIVMTESGRLIEIQGTAEHHPFTIEEMNALLKLADKGTRKIFRIQNKILSS